MQEMYFERADCVGIEGIVAQGEDSRENSTGQRRGGRRGGRDDLAGGSKV